MKENEKQLPECESQKCAKNSPDIFWLTLWLFNYYLHKFLDSLNLIRSTHIQIINIAMTNGQLSLRQELDRSNHANNLVISESESELRWIIWREMLPKQLYFVFHYRWLELNIGWILDSDKSADSINLVNDFAYFKITRKDYLSLMKIIKISTHSSQQKRKTYIGLSDSSLLKWNIFLENQWESEKRLRFIFNQYINWAELRKDNNMILLDNITIQKRFDFTQRPWLDPATLDYHSWIMFWWFWWKLIQLENIWIESKTCKLSFLLDTQWESSILLNPTSSNIQELINNANNDKTFWEIELQLPWENNSTIRWWFSFKSASKIFNELKPPLTRINWILSLDEWNAEKILESIDYYKQQILSH